MYRFPTLLAALTLGLTALPLPAEVLLIDTVTDAAAVPTPVRGTAMATVRDRFGDPRQALPAVGEPPITRWSYPDFTVYFEHDRVIHAVVRRDQP